MSIKKIKAVTDNGRLEIYHIGGGLYTLNIQDFIKNLPSEYIEEHGSEVLIESNKHELQIIKKTTDV